MIEFKITPLTLICSYALAERTGTVQIKKFTAPPLHPLSPAKREKKRHISE